ncbi:hypothetical protein DMENIID0001_130520 [Sergentomyia squamirostris]
MATLKTINDLPNELLEFILDKLPPYRDLDNCELVCTRWVDLVKHVRIKQTTNFKKAIMEGNMCWQKLQSNDAEAKVPASRFGHSAAVCNGTMYIFGGRYAEKGIHHNDLWAFDLSTGTWEHCNSYGPHPKAFATMVSHEDQLIVFGGGRILCDHDYCLFSDVHVYNLALKKWVMPEITSECPPPMCGHGATIHERKMVIFGGGMKIDHCPHCALEEGTLMTLSNDVWTLDLDTFVWQHQEASLYRPIARVSHYQIYIDETHLLIVGGSGQTQGHYTDMWLLTMTSPVWTWQEVSVRQKNNGPNKAGIRNSAFRIDQKLIVLEMNDCVEKAVQSSDEAGTQDTASGGVDREYRTASFFICDLSHVCDDTDDPYVEWLEQKEITAGAPFSYSASLVIVLKLLRMETQKEESSAGAVADENSEFYNTGRVGRRNALPDILSEHCRTSTAELPERLDAISISDNPSPEAGPSGASTSTASCTATTSNTTNEKT